ncbi:MAG: DNA polymerase III subunit delta' [Myxococcota bacterium]
MVVPRLADIVGHAARVEALRDALRRNRVAHAFLLEGPDGVGKHAVAKGFASALLCSNPVDGDACGECPACIKVAIDSHPDLHRVEANDKDNILLDSLRAVEQVIHLRAMEGGRKVVLIDGAERMKAPVQNALLKTLEEPPAATHLVLVTGRPRALLPTIASRCQRLIFGSLRPEEVERVLSRASPELSREARKGLARIADGSPGRALALDYDALRERQAQVIALDRALDPDAPRALNAALERSSALAKEQRPTLGELLDTWTSWSRDQVLHLVGQPIVHFDRAEELAELADHRGLDVCLHRTEALLEARRQLDLPFNLNPQVVLEQLGLTLVGAVPLRRLPFVPDASRAQ